METHVQPQASHMSPGSHAEQEHLDLCCHAYRLSLVNIHSTVRTSCQLVLCCIPPKAKAAWGGSEHWVQGRQGAMLC